MADEVKSICNTNESYCEMWAREHADQLQKKEKVVMPDEQNAGSERQAEKKNKSRRKNA